MHEAGPLPDAITHGQSSAAPAPPALLVCFSHLRWSFVFQRPQHLLTRAARHFRVVFVEEPSFEPVAAPRLQASTDSSGVTVAIPILPESFDETAAQAAQRKLIDGLLAREKGRPQVFWYYTPMAFGFTDHHEPDLCVYDCMDELSAFQFAAAELKERERALLNRADLVFTGGLSLYEAKKGRHPNVHAFPSSIDAPHFGRARAAQADPADQAPIPHPRLGFFGVIDERMDLELLRRIALLRPDWQFVMIGPVVKIDEASLPRSANIHWLGGKSYGELPNYLAGWDVGLMPFAINESTRYISPTKTPEFLAAGVPVVSTAVVDVVRSYGNQGLVEIASDAEATVAKAEAALSRPKRPWLERVDRHLSGLSWERTWDAMHALMKEQLQVAAQPPVGSAAQNREAAHV